MPYQNSQHDMSHKLARNEIKAKMRGRKSAVTVDGALDGARRLYYSCLERIGTLILEDYQSTFYSVAVDIIPTGFYNAQAHYPSGGLPFVLLHSGAIDFSGNMATLGMGLIGNSDRRSEFILSEQDVVDYIWSSALIYYDAIGDWDGGLEAIHTPKLNYFD